MKGLHDASEGAREGPATNARGGLRLASASLQRVVHRQLPAAIGFNPSHARDWLFVLSTHAPSSAFLFDLHLSVQARLLLSCVTFETAALPAYFIQLPHHERSSFASCTRTCALLIELRTCTFTCSLAVTASNLQQASFWLHMPRDPYPKP